MLSLPETVQPMCDREWQPPPLQTLPEPMWLWRCCPRKFPASLLSCLVGIICWELTNGNEYFPFLYSDVEVASTFKMLGHVDDIQSMERFKGWRSAAEIRVLQAPLLPGQRQEGGHC